MNNTFKYMYYINLDRRIDRWDECMERINTTCLVNFPYTRFSAFNGNFAYDTGLTDIDGKAIYSNFSGTYNSPGSYRIRSTEANKNLYFTTSNGIQKISATDASDFTTAANYIQPAGAIKAIDFTTTLELTQGQVSGYLPVDSATAYRHVWGYKDANNNLILGSPSARSLVYNLISNSIVMDFNRLLYILDIFGSSGTGLISNTNYYSTYALSANPLGDTVKANIMGLAAKIDTDLLLGDVPGAAVLKMSTIAMDANSGVVTVTFSVGNPTTYISVGDYVKFTGLTTASPNLTIFNGSFQTTQVTSTTIQFVYVPPTGTTLTAIAATAPNSGSLMYSYNYENITHSGDDSFPTSLNDTVILSPTTSGEWATMQDTIQRIVNRLGIELPAVLSASLISEYITPYTITTYGNVQVNIDIPSDSNGNQLNSSYFLQVYRSNVFNAFSGNQQDGTVLGVTAIPDDELHLVYEYFPTTTDFANGYVSFLDTYPDNLAQNNTPLYTNPVTGDGILQSNDLPPLAQDINLFNNVVFYANTKSSHLLNNFQLLGVDNIVSGDKITIANANESTTLTFKDGVQEKTTFTVTAASAAALKTAIQNKYFTINNSGDVNKYYVWYRYDGSGVDPLVAGRTGIIVDLITGDTVALACQRTAETLNNLIFDFIGTYTPTTFVITNVSAGTTSTATIGNISGANLSLVITTTGDGENLTTGQVLISRTVSAAINIQLTAQSLVRVINHSATSPVYAYYTSGDNTSPGQMTLQAKVLADIPFYVIASGPQYGNGTSGIGTSFSPNISPIHVITGSIATSGTSGYITFTSTAHGLQNGSQILITNTNCVSIADGVFTVANVTTNTFDVLHAAITPGTHFSWELLTDSIVSTNTNSLNRLYYSKFNQPDAVPLLNYFEIGRADKAILRIFPLRTSLFVFKEDGLYRISGQTAPFSVQLFDSSCILTAPDTVDVTDNIVYGWTLKGITQVSESGTNEVSKPIDIELFRLASFPNFKTLTWGLGYNSDYSYTVYTNSADTDTEPTIGFRYSNRTNTWTNVVRTQTAGIVKSENDLMYLGSGISNIINQERKNYDRTDYADKDFTLQIQPNTLNATGSTLLLSSVSEISVGDVFLQDQTLTIYRFNNLLQQLDLEPTLAGNYYSTLQANIGDNLRSKIVLLAAKLDADPGTVTKTYSAHVADYTVAITSNSIANPTVVTTSIAHNLVDGRVVTISSNSGSIPTIDSIYTISNTGVWGTSHTFTVPVSVTTGGTGGTASTAATSTGFTDIEACYNAMIGLLNNDTGIAFSSFTTITFDTPMEAMVINVDQVSKIVTFNIGLQWVIGPVQVYKAIPCEIIYAPLTFGDVLQWKQIFQATAMFSNTAFSNALLSFSSDLKPDYISVAFKNLGNGIFGSYSDPGFGGGYFGGGGNAKPFRTFIPLQSQRCRFLNVKWNHQVAREICEFYGVTLSGNISESLRAYR